MFLLTAQKVLIQFVFLFLVLSGPHLISTTSLLFLLVSFIAFSYSKVDLKKQKISYMHRRCMLASLSVVIVVMVVICCAGTACTKAGAKIKPE